MVTEMKREDTLLVCDSPKVFSARMKNLHELRKNRTFCDVVLQVENAEIYAHRSVLACASSYFFELFTAEDDIKSATEDKLIYKLNGGFDKYSIESLVTYAYTGELEITPSRAKAVYIAASKLKMEDIARACGEHLVANLTPETCLELRAIPGVSSNQQLVAAIDHFIQQQPDLISVTESAHDVPRIMLSVIHGTKDEAGIMTRALCNLAFEWIQKQMVEEEMTFSVLCEKTHLLYLNLDNSLHDCIDLENGAVNDSEVVQDYKKISRKLSQPSMKVKRKGIMVPQPVKPRMMLFSRSISEDNTDQSGDWKLISYSRVADNSVVAVVTLNNFVAVLSINQQISLPSTDIIIPSRHPSVEKIDGYTLISNMRSPKCGSGVGTLNGKVIVCGGYDRGECLIDVECYDPDNNSWTSLANMREGRGRFDLTIVDGKAYAVGGCNGSRELNSVEVYEPGMNEWYQVAPLPLPRSNTGVCGLYGKIYCVGGWNGQVGIRQCDVYDPETDTWDPIDPLSQGRYQAAVTSLDGKIYAVGGCDSWNCLNSVEVYDSALGLWRHGPPLNTPRRGCGVGAINGCLYVVGGSDGTHSLCSTEIFDPQTNSWVTGPPMTNCRANVGVAILNDRLYAIGGFSGKTFLNTIEFLDPNTNEWTTFTPKPDYLRSNSYGDKSVVSDIGQDVDLGLPDSDVGLPLPSDRPTNGHGDYSNNKSAPISIRGGRSDTHSDSDYVESFGDDSDDNIWQQVDTQYNAIMN